MGIRSRWKWTDSASGASRRTRELVETVARLAEESKRGGPGPVSVKRVADALSLDRVAAGRRVRVALKGGWLVNAEPRKGYPYDLAPGDPLPEEAGLPRPEELDCNTITLETGGSRQGAGPTQNRVAALGEG